MSTPLVIDFNGLIGSENVCRFDALAWRVVHAAALPDHDLIVEAWQRRLHEQKKSS